MLSGVEVVAPKAPGSFYALRIVPVSRRRRSVYALALRSVRPSGPGPDATPTPGLRRVCILYR